VTSRPRRDFLLDSGGVSALAASRDLLLAYLELLEQRFDGALLIPIPVLTEVRSGHRRSDALVDRNTMRRVVLDDDLTMLIGPASDGALLEVGVLDIDGDDPVVIHAQPLRPKLYELL
jgi:hypothetical protein